jgi:catechol 2,3-dioxygenase-like lactoylglutathione lyase family enzyme
LLVFRPQSTRLGDRLPAHGTDGSGHFAMGIAAADHGAWRDRLIEHGVVIEHEEAWPHGGHSLYFRDPADNLVELITPGVWGLAAGW